MAEWLASPAVVSADGDVRSWHNARQDGFAYPEAAAWWLGWASWRRDRGEAAPDASVVRKVADRLTTRLHEDRGIGKDGRTYLFDTCVAARGLARVAADARLAWQNPGWTAAVTSALRAFLDNDSCVAPTVGDPERWSQQWGAHLERAAALLDEAALLSDRRAWQDEANRLRERRAALGPSTLPEYLHARLYAAEGTRAREEARGGPDSGLARRVAEELARRQRPGGGLPAWMHGGGAERADVTAQALRLWAAIGGTRWAAPARGALAWLATTQRDDGAFAYESGSDDANTWATLFADQAVAWALQGPEPRGWI